MRYVEDATVATREFVGERITVQVSDGDVVPRRACIKVCDANWEVSETFQCDVVNIYRQKVAD